MWVTKLLISPVKKRIFCPKTTKFGSKLAFLVNLGQAMQAYSVPCWWVGWWLWRAGCISQDTYLLYNILADQKTNIKSSLAGIVGQVSPGTKVICKYRGSRVLSSAPRRGDRDRSREPTITQILSAASCFSDPVPFSSIIIIIITRPKPPVGRQGLAGSWGKDKVRRVNFGVFSTSHFAHLALSSD